MRRRIWTLWLVLLLVHALTRPLQGAGIEALERDVERLDREVEALRAARAEEPETTPLLDPDSWLRRFHLGGYGEIHANLAEGAAADEIDIHRLVLYLGHDFADWVKLHSETELEHALVSDGSGGELSIEQLHVDLLLSEHLNIRVGRVLTPLGIINKEHEPPRFHGVERPTFARYVIPTTWSSDGAGLFGRPLPWLAYEIYVVGGLDGSKFDAIDGIREGRIKERPSLHEPAFTGRVDLTPFAGMDLPLDQALRVGLSAYGGGLDNGNDGADPGIHGDIRIYSTDVRFRICGLRLRGVLAYEEIGGARSIGRGTAEAILGWYVEAAYPVWPAAWKRGKLASADAFVFLRYDDVDTQHDLPSGVAKDRRGDRSEWTLGITVFLTPRFALKADYQVLDDARSKRLDDRVNLGVGWVF